MNFILSYANRILIITMSILLILSIISLIKEQSIWNMVSVIMLSISWFSFLLFIFIAPKKAEKSN